MEAGQGCHHDPAAALTRVSISQGRGVRWTVDFLSLPPPSVCRHHCRSSRGSVSGLAALPSRPASRTLAGAFQAQSAPMGTSVPYGTRAGVARGIQGLEKWGEPAKCFLTVGERAETQSYFPTFWPSFYSLEQEIISSIS